MHAMLKLGSIGSSGTLDGRRQKPAVAAGDGPCDQAPRG